MLEASLWMILMKPKFTAAVRSNILSKLSFARCMNNSDRAYYGLCVFIKDTCRRLPLQLQCSFQGKQGDVGQSVRVKYIAGFCEG